MRRIRSLDSGDLFVIGFPERKVEQMLAPVCTELVEPIPKRQALKDAGHFGFGDLCIVKVIYLALSERNQAEPKSEESPHTRQPNHGANKMPIRSPGHML